VIPLAFHAAENNLQSEDTINFTFVDGVGHPVYFRAVRDYLVEHREHVFLDDVEIPGGFPTGTDFRLVAVLMEKTTMSVVDAKTSDLNGIDAAANAFPNAAIIINGTFFTAADPLNFFYGRFTEGRIVNANDELLEISMPVAPDRQPAYKGCFGQRNDGDFVFARSTEITSLSVRAGVSGLAAFIPKQAGESYYDIIDAINTIHPNQYRSAVAHIGIANRNAERILFTLFTASQSASAFPQDLDRAPLFERLETSGTSVCYGLDGGSSIGVARENSFRTLEVVVRGAKHGPLSPWKVNNYLIFHVED
jgi:hypothetical protein